LVSEGRANSISTLKKKRALPTEEVAPESDDMSPVKSFV
jgi:hypothetical protein